MKNQEKLICFIEELLQERLIFSSSRPKKDLSTKGAMYFIQETKIINNELYYITNKSKHYPNGLIKKDTLIEMLKKHTKKNPLAPHKLEMNPIGKWMGNTSCRCCNKSLGNGGGYAIFEHENKKYGFNLTGGANHYIDHKINLNLISYSWVSKEKNIKIHTQFVGDVKDVHLIEEFVQTLQMELKVKKDKSSEINSSNESIIKPKTKRKMHL